MNFRLSGHHDWQRIKDYVASLAWQRPKLHDGKPVIANGQPVMQGIQYRVTIEEIAEDAKPEQNALQHVWYELAHKQLRDMTAEEYRAYCKLHFGVPILRRDSEDFRAAYDRVIRPLPYELKLAAMAHPLDFPITRLMNKRQKAEFLDATCNWLVGLGVDLERRAA